jgi:hypothetical protein
MPRDRQRLTLDGGPKLDLARLIPKGLSRPGAVIRTTLTYASGLVVQVEIRLDEEGGTLVVSSGGRTQTFRLAAQERHFGGQQYYLICPRTGKEGAGALPARRRTILRQPPCLGPRGWLRLAVPRSHGARLAHQSQGEAAPPGRC